MDPSNITNNQPLFTFTTTKGKNTELSSNSSNGSNRPDTPIPSPINHRHIETAAKSSSQTSSSSQSTLAHRTQVHRSGSTKTSMNSNLNNTHPQTTRSEQERKDQQALSQTTLSLNLKSDQFLKVREELSKGVDTIPQNSRRPSNNFGPNEQSPLLNHKRGRENEKLTAKSALASNNNIANSQSLKQPQLGAQNLSSQLNNSSNNTNQPPHNKFFSDSSSVDSNSSSTGKN